MERKERLIHVQLYNLKLYLETTELLKEHIKRKIKINFVEMWAVKDHIQVTIHETIDSQYNRYINFKHSRCL